MFILLPLLLIFFLTNNKRRLKLVDGHNFDNICQDQANQKSIILNIYW